MGGVCLALNPNVMNYRITVDNLTDGEGRGVTRHSGWVTIYNSYSATPGICELTAGLTVAGRWRDRWGTRRRTE